MRTVSYDELRKMPTGTIFVHDSPDEFVSRAMMELGVDVPKTSQTFRVLEREDLKKWQEKIEFALGLTRPKKEEEPCNDADS